jgi:hypothetical protein
MGNFIILQDQWKNPEQDGRTTSGRTHPRSKEYEDVADEQKTQKNGGVF